MTHGDETYRAFDGTAYSAPATMIFWIVPMNDPPTFEAGSSAVFGTEDTAYSGSWASNVSPGPANESGQAVLFEIHPVEQPGPSLFSVPPAIDASGNLTFTPVPNAVGSVTMRVHAKDDGGTVNFGSGSYDAPDDTSDSVTFDIHIIGTNDPPNAVYDVIEMLEDGGEVTRDVVGNDPDIDSWWLEVVAVSVPAHGTANLGVGVGTVRYRPDPDWNGSDSFTYTVDDGAGGQDTGIVLVTVVPANDGPIADDDGVTVNEDQTTPVAVLVGDTDVDGDVLHVTSVANGANGIVTIDGDGLAVRYTPNANVSGSDTFSYTVSDGSGGTDSAIVDVTIVAVNDPPDAIDDGSLAPLYVDQGAGPRSLAILGNDTSAPDTGETLSIVAITQGAHGVVAIAGDGADVTYDPVGLYSGPDQFTYTISDGHGSTDTATVHISVMLDITPPVVTGPRIVISSSIGAPTVRASISWSATELQTGISLYKLQQQTDGGAWTAIPLSSPTASKVKLTLATGHTYRFRVRATDGLGNVGVYATSRLIRL